MTYADTAPTPDTRLTPAMWRALASLSLSMLMPSLDTSIANVALPSLARAFGASFQGVQWIVLAYLLAITTLIVSAGRLGDLVGRRRLLLVGIAIFTVASLFCGAAPTLPLLVAARAIQGFGAAIMMALTVALVSETVPPARTGSAMGLLGTMSAIGTTLGPSLGGLLIASTGWRMIFLINVPLGVLNFVLAWRALPADHEPTRAPRIRFDITGTLLLAFALGAYALAMTYGHGAFGTRNLALLAVAVTVAVFFVAVERRAESPLLQLAMFRAPALGVGLALSVVVSTVMMATLVVGPFYLSRALGLDTARVGLVMSAGPLMSALAGVPAGRLVDRFGAARMSLAGLTGMAAGLVALANAPQYFGVLGYLLAIIVVTSHYAQFQAANNTSIMTGVATGQRGVVSGMLSLSRNLGLVTGASAMGAVFAFASGATDITSVAPAAVAHGMQVTFIMAAALIGVALAVAASARLRASRAVLTTTALALSVATLPAQATTGTASRVADPFPLSAAGWGPMTGKNLFACRWAEDWLPARTSGAAPRFKAMPLGGTRNLTLSGELRLRFDAVDNGQLRSGNDYGQGLLRGVAGADLRLSEHLRAYAELGTGQIAGRRATATANFQNEASLQQLFIDARAVAGDALLGAMIGRQEFADGPRQLVSLSDGPNLHRTWNGVRLYAHLSRVRVGAFAFDVTRPGRASFDERAERNERLAGVSASIRVVGSGPDGDMFIEPLWLQSENAAFRLAGHVANDRRNTLATRVWGRRDNLAFDWTVAAQRGEVAGRRVNAWGMFAVQSVQLVGVRWRPRLGLRLDVASGGGSFGRGTVRSFSPLYASSNYLSEGQLLGASNLLLLTPGITLTPSSRSSIALETGVAFRLDPHDAAYAGGMRPYVGTQQVAGRAVGALSRGVVTRSLGTRWTTTITHEHLFAGDVLRRARLSPGSYSYAGITFRY